MVLRRLYILTIGGRTLASEVSEGIACGAIVEEASCYLGSIEGGVRRKGSSGGDERASIKAAEDGDIEGRAV